MNPYASQHWNLNPACLPIPPTPRNVALWPQIPLTQHFLRYLTSDILSLSVGGSCVTEMIFLDWLTILHIIQNQWCGIWDLNPYEHNSLAPQASLSANSSNPALLALSKFQPKFNKFSTFWISKRSAGHNTKIIFIMLLRHFRR